MAWGLSWGCIARLGSLLVAGKKRPVLLFQLFLHPDLYMIRLLRTIVHLDLTSRTRTDGSFLDTLGVLGMRSKMRSFGRVWGLIMSSMTIVSRTPSVDLS